MQLPFNKVYSIPINRKLVSGVLVKSKTPTSSHIYLDSNGCINYSIRLSQTNNYLSTIYNINRTRNKTTVTTNTINFSATNILFNDSPMYQMIDISTYTAEYINDTLLGIVKHLVGDDRFLVTSDKIYLNTDVKYLIDGLIYIPVLPVVSIGSSSNTLANVQIVRLKDRIKVVFSHTIPNEQLYFKLNDKYVLSPIIKNNRWIEIPECVIIYNNKPLHIFNHSFKLEYKREIHSVNNTLDLKDPVDISSTSNITSEVLNINNLIFSYTSYRTNLLLNVDLSKDLYVYIRNTITPDLTYVPFIYSVSETQPDNATLLFSINRKVDYENLYVKLNTYCKKIVYGNKGEDIFLSLDGGLNNKYSLSQNVPLGKNLIKMDWTDITTRYSTYLVKSDGNRLYQREAARDWSSINTYDLGSALSPQIFSLMDYLSKKRNIYGLNIGLS